MTERADAIHVKLAEKLRFMLNAAPERGESPMFHLFGIMYAMELKDMAMYELHYITSRAGSPDETMGTEIRKGVKLAQYVDVKPAFQRHPSKWEYRG